MVGEITYSYTPEDWDQERFLELGGFTVVFLNYNKAAFIEKSVASALNQDFERLEMFFMDDASPDGSGDTMEQLVRAYRGRHKVTVVRNTENQHITGQWNIVSKLATGNWYGMFCGDDVARPDRVTRASEIVKTYPTLLGFYTGGEERTTDGELVGRYGDWLTDEEAKGTMNPTDFLVEASSAVGATAFYHRRVFARQLTKAPLDDALLRWIAQWEGRESDALVWKTFKDIDTVDYTVGSGISSEMIFNEKNRGWKAEDYLKANESLRKFTALKLKSLRGVEAYYRGVGASREYLIAIRLGELLCESISGNTLSRLFSIVPRTVVLTIVSSAKGSVKKHILKSVLKDLAREFFGLRFYLFLKGR